MEVSEVVQLIQSVGFPIVMCGAMGWFVWWQTKENNCRMDELTEKHHKEMESITTALNNNTVAITKLTERLKNANV